MYYNILHFVQLLPECAPQSVSYILELLATHHCPGCHLYRAESRGSAWDLEGNHIQDVRIFMRSFRKPIILLTFYLFSLVSFSTKQVL